MDAVDQAIPASREGIFWSRLFGILREYECFIECHDCLRFDYGGSVPSIPKQDNGKKLGKAIQTNCFDRFFGSIDTNMHGSY